MSTERRRYTIVFELDVDAVRFGPTDVPDDLVMTRDAEIERLRAELAHPAYEFVRQAFADGRTITRLIPPEDCLHGIRYAGFYCQDYTGPTEGVAPPDSAKAR